MPQPKCGFCKKYFDKNEPLTSADLEKNGGQKCSPGQRFIFTEVTFYKIHILVLSSNGLFQMVKNEGSYCGFV